MAKKIPQKKSEKLKKGDLVLLVDNKNKNITGVILDTKEWPNEGALALDIYVHWSSGETYWCISNAVKRIGHALKNK
jgi:hypothetical protein